LVQWRAVRRRQGIALDARRHCAGARGGWAAIDPSIFGTLFERGLDPDKRSQLGAHYTDRDKIMLIVEPVIIRPWLAEWEMTKTVIAGHMEAVDKARARRPTR
jgi:hypothetical protein